MNFFFGAWLHFLLLYLHSVCAAAKDRKQLGFPVPPDTRPKGCQKYKKAAFVNHSVSIIIPWLNEKWMHMEGTMRSLLHFTPDELVEEFIWVSDGNADAKQKELEAMSSKVRVHAFPERVGLMIAKMKGVEMAKGNVLVFMEAHCIVNRHWLQHILHRVVLNPKILAMPSLDMIHQDDWNSYFPQTPGHWRYEWNFNLIYTNPGGVIKRGSPEPYPSPGTSGGIFAMRKDWFERLGLFDAGMKEWGGDHMELTMKVWRCGGRIEIIPCSRVGHLFRDPDHRPYYVAPETVVHNYKRLAELWAKDHLDIFYKMKPEARAMKLKGMDKVKKNYETLESELGCKNLAWYLENVDHEMAWEKPIVCHPFADAKDPIKCKGDLVPGRWTVTKEMSGEQFLAAKAAVGAKAKKLEAAAANKTKKSETKKSERSDEL